LFIVCCLVAALVWRLALFFICLVFVVYGLLFKPFELIELSKPFEPF
jgi:hypothetical protein